MENKNNEKRKNNELGIVYLVKPAILKDHPRYKIGCSGRVNCDRILEYGTETEIISIKKCSYPYLLESILKACFNLKFLNFFGNEFFEGEIEEMFELFESVSYQYRKLYKDNFPEQEFETLGIKFSIKNRRIVISGIQFCVDKGTPSEYIINLSVIGQKEKMAIIHESSTFVKTYLEDNIGNSEDSDSIFVDVEVADELDNDNQDDNVIDDICEDNSQEEDILEDEHPKDEFYQQSENSKIDDNSENNQETNGELDIVKSHLKKFHQATNDINKYNDVTDGIYKCELCNYTTRQKGHLNRHNKTTKHLENLKKKKIKKYSAHREGNEYICEICGKSFKHRTSIPKHFKSTHPNKINNPLKNISKKKVVELEKPPESQETINPQTQEVLDLIKNALTVENKPPQNVTLTYLDEKFPNMISITKFIEYLDGDYSLTDNEAIHLALTFGNFDEFIVLFHETLIKKCAKILKDLKIKVDSNVKLPIICTDAGLRTHNEKSDIGWKKVALNNHLEKLVNLVFKQMEEKIDFEINFSLQKKKFLMSFIKKNNAILSRI